VIHLTGQVAWDEHSNVVGIGDAEAQMEKSIDNVRAILRAVGGTLDDPALAFVSASLPRRAAGAGH
jgi:enamine deaminase RidA (YjgF/YER057c/UK114 family)